MSHPFNSALLLLAALLLAQCASLKSKGPQPVEGSEDSKEGPSYLVGIVEWVNPEQAFVLIKTESVTVPMPPGHTLSVLDATGSLSEVVISPERRGNRLTADIRSGTPRPGNLVIYRPKFQENPNPGAASAGAPVSPQPAAEEAPAVQWLEGQPPPFQPLGAAPLAVPESSPIPPAQIAEPAVEPLPGDLPPVIE